MVRVRVLTLTLVSVLTSAVIALAQDDAPEEEQGEPVDEGMPTTTGRNEATASVGQRGMIFELASKARLMVPAGLPIGASRRMTFGEVSGAFDNALVHESFRRVGAVLRFNAAIDATRAPVEVSIRQTRDPARPGTRLVLAMEHPAMCSEGMPTLPGHTNMCSTWHLLDARYDTSERRLVASMTTPGGFRLVFGQVAEGVTQ